MMSNKKKLSESASKLSNQKSFSLYGDQSTTCLDMHNKSSYVKSFMKFLRPQPSSHDHGGEPNPQLKFEPQIHHLPEQLYPNQQESYQKSKEQIFQRLIQNNTIKVRERLKAKLQIENYKMQDCTFQPKVSQFKVQEDTQLTFQDQNNVFDRLYQNAQDKAELFLEKEKQKKQKQDEELTKLQNPKEKNYLKHLNPQKYNLAPLHERLNEIVSQKLKKNKQLEQKFKKQSNFKPDVSENSKKIFDQKLDKEKLKRNVVQRLMNEYKKSSEAKQKEKKQFLAEQKKLLTFKPNINTNFISFKDSPTERLKTGSRKCVHDDPHCTFVPKIDHMSNLIIKHSRGDEEQEDKINRLAYQDIENKTVTIEKITSEVYGQCTFKPQINELSSKFNPQPQRHCCQKPPQPQYPFRPKINQKSRLIRSNSLQTTQLKQSKRKQKYQYEQEYQQLKQCTFKPKINLSRQKQARKLGEVQGIHEWMGKIQKIRSIKEFKKQTQQKLFQLQKRYDKRMGIQAQ